MKIFLIIATTLFYFSSCEPSKGKIDSLIHSTGSCDRIKGFELIGKYKDTSFLKDIFIIRDDDKHVCHGFKHYGKTPLWAKIKALERITGVKLPYNYTAFTLDSTALLFYKKILVANGQIAD